MIAERGIPAIVGQAMSAKWAKGSAGPAGDEHHNLIPCQVSHALSADGFDASEDGTGRGVPLVPVNVADTLTSNGDAHSGYRDEKSLLAIAIQERAVSENPAAGPQGAGFNAGGAAYTLEARHHVRAVAYDQRGREGGAQFEGPHDTANIRSASGGSSKSFVLGQIVHGNQGLGGNLPALPALPADAPHTTLTCDGQPNSVVLGFGNAVDTTGHQGDKVVGPGDVWPCLAAQTANNGGGGGGGGGGLALVASESWAVRRLTPRECERLQGFPDDHTAILYRGKPAADGPRYKAIGNSMAVNVMRWIGLRIALADAAAGGRP